MYVPSCELAPAQLKPGQSSLQRQLYTHEAKDHNETYMEIELEKGSVYKRTIESLLNPSDYYAPRKPIIPGEPSMDEVGHRGCAHWKSEYRSNVNDAARFDTVLHRQNGPSYQIANPPTCVGGGDILSTYSEGYGKYGSDPRHRIPKDAIKMPVLKTALTVGTTKGTNHMPGYQGFLAQNTANARVAEVTHGGTLRSTDKTNLTQCYHSNVVGYSGHRPQNACNDRGGVQPTILSTMGSAFQHPPPESYA